MLRSAEGSRPRLAVATTFSIHPPVGGGQVRAFHLCRELARAFDIEVIALVDSDAVPNTRQLGPGLRQQSVPKSARHRARELELETAAGTVVTDIAMSELFELTPDYLEALAAATRPARAAIACHPYTYPAIRAVTEAPVWYDAQDVEVTLKGQVLGSGADAQELLTQVRDVERACCRDAELTWTCSSEDRAELLDRYGADPDRIVVVPNGVALDSAEFVALPARRALQRRLRLDHRLAVFIASWHPPNTHGARALLPIAAACPDFRFLVVGSVGLALREELLPGNLELSGVVSPAFKESVLSVADVALNPITTGSGTNLKMLDYFAGGVPVVSTRFGARGLEAQRGEHFIEAELHQMPDSLHALASAEDAGLAALIDRARSLVEERLSWTVIGRQLREALAARSIVDAA